MRSDRSRLLVGAAAVALLSAATESALAQDRRVEEIVVTAQKRVQNLQEVPVSATVITERQRELAGARRFRDLQFYIPNLIFRGNETHGTTRIALRGIATDRRNIGFNSGVGMYVNDVFQGNITSYNQDLMDIERVEVLRGPQGTLFGRNTLAGAINISTKKPNLEEIEGHVRGEYGRFDAVRAGGSVNLPIVNGKAAARLAVSYANSDGYAKNLFTGTRLANENEIAFRAQFRIQPTDNFILDIEGDGAFEDRIGYNGGYFDAVPGGLVDMLDAESPDPWSVYYDTINDEVRDMGGVSIRAAYELANGYEVTAITAWRTIQIDEFVEGDRLPIPDTVVDFYDEQTQFTQELRIASPEDDRFNWLAGFFYIQQDDATDRTLIFDSPGFAGDRRVVSSIDTKAYAGFGHAEYDITDRLVLFGGARITYTEKDLNFQQFATAPGSVVPIPLSRDSYSENNFSPEAGLRYELSDSVNTYAKFSRGFKSGGFNADYISDTNKLDFDSEKVSAYEVGVKSDLLDNRLRVNLAAFLMDYSDQQVSVFLGDFLGYRVDNAASAELYGFELETQAVLFDSLDVSAGIGYTHGEYDDYDDNAGTVYTGNRVINAPEWTANIALTHTAPLGSGLNLVTHGEYSYRGDLYTSPSNSDTSYLEAAHMVNGRIGIASDDGWSIFLWSKNITNEANVNFGFTSGSRGGRMNQYDPPRTYGVEAKVSF